MRMVFDDRYVKHKHTYIKSVQTETSIWSANLDETYRFFCFFMGIFLFFFVFVLWEGGQGGGTTFK